jgi:putative redox protein
VLCHGFPTGPRGATASASTFPELADRIARETGCVTLTFNFRGTGTSEGDFSASGWRADIDAAAGELVGTEGVKRVSLVGVNEGGTFALAAAAADPRVGAVATLAAPRSLRDLAREPGRVAVYARRVGMISTAGFPPSLPVWSRELLEIDGEAAAGQLGGRPLLVLHGSNDTVVDAADARALVAAAGSHGELRMVQAAGHELRHDPRAIAALLGWLDRLPQD